jgi:hypothetical protein
MMTGILFSFPADWRRQILKIVLVLELELELDSEWERAFQTRA